MTGRPSPDLACPVCGGKNLERSRFATSVYSDGLYELAGCADCTHLVTLNAPSPGELARLYGTTYNYESHEAIEDEKRWRFAGLERHIGRMISREAEVVDVGCGHGEVLRSLRVLGYARLVGIEVGSPAVEKCRAHGLDVFQGTFSQWAGERKDAPAKGGKCVILSHVIEHVENLDDLFGALASFLEPGDCVLVMVPNAKARTAKFLGRYWGWWQVPVHLHHFTETSLHKLLSSKGFSAELTLSRGADSLFFLSCLAALLRVKSRSQRISKFQRVAVRMCSIALKNWLFLGNEELVVFARKD